MQKQDSKRQHGSETVILVHGIWMHGLLLNWLAKQLRKQGYGVIRFSYRSLSQTPAESADRLATVVDSVKTPVVHLVGHSLGGIILLHLMDRQTRLKPGRVVLLGSPVKGSLVAANIMRIPVLRNLLLGKSIYQGLVGGVPGFSGQRELGVICGNKPYGVGRLFTLGGQPNDGTVYVRETKLAMARDHIELNVTHTSMVFSRQVAKQIGCFLENGSFCKFERKHGGS